MKNNPPLLSDFIKSHPEYKEEVTERASIMEYEGGVERARAEVWAVIRVGRKYNLFSRRGGKL